MFQLNRLILPMLLGAVFMPSLHADGRKKDARAAPALTTIVTFQAALNGAAALPGNSEPATGDVTGSYDPQTHVFRFNAHFYELSGPATNAKFHGPAAFDRGGWATVAAPRPESRFVAGTAVLDSEEEQDLLEGRWYFNVTTAKHPEGEIRGMVHINR